MIRRLFIFLMVLLLQIYKLTLSHVFAFFGVRCRHEPTCSTYGIKAIRSHGPWTGGWLTLSRLLRCHPYGTHGHDPVPPNTGPRGKFWEIWKLGVWSWRQADVKGKGQNRNL